MGDIRETSKKQCSLEKQGSMEIKYFHSLSFNKFISGRDTLNRWLNAIVAQSKNCPFITNTTIELKAIRTTTITTSVGYVLTNNSAALFE